MREIKPAELYKTRAPELLSDLADHARDVLVKAGMGDASNDLAWDLVERMTKVWGGQNLYFPRGLTFEQIRRDLTIYSEFNGTNQPQLAQKYHLSVQAVYEIIKTQRKRVLSEVQGDLFNTPSNMPEK